MSFVLFGAGAAGRYILEARVGGIAAFTDNDPEKWGTTFGGVPVLSPQDALKLHGDKQWVACAISRPSAKEIRGQLTSLGVSTRPLCEILPVHHGLPSATVRYSLSRLADDMDTLNELRDQYLFRATPDYDLQRDPSAVEEIYFPPFISHRDDEHFVDCGAADGDTIRAFRDHWPNYGHITAFEPDPNNFDKLPSDITTYSAAIGDADKIVKFAAHGDYSSHIVADGEFRIAQWRLDGVPFRTPPTYIKMDIEGSELEALWGARRILQQHSPVLAICAYHTSEHLWQIPLLIHALQPEYKLFLRRYAEGAFELVWYAVPPERIR